MTPTKTSPQTTLPPNWQIFQLGDVADIIMGQSPPGQSYNEKGIGFPFLQGKAEFTDIYPNHVKYTVDPKKIAPQNSVLMSVRAPVGDVNIANIDYCIGRGLASLSLKNGDNRFLFYKLKQQKNKIEAEGTGSTFKAINIPNLKKFIIPLPPLGEQEKIAGVLGVVQAAREKTRGVIEAAKALKKSMMHHLFTYGPVPLLQKDSIPLKQTEIGPLPHHWQIVTLKEIGEIITGTTPSTKIPEYYGSEFMFIGPGDIDDNRYVKKTVKYLSKTGLDVSRPLPKESVLVVCIGATIGKAAMTYTDRCTTNQQINTIVPSKNVSNQYVYYSISYHSHRLSSFSGRAAVPIVNKSNFEKFQIPLPPLGEQEEMAGILADIDRKIEVEEGRLAALDGLFRSMLEHLMTGRVRVHELEWEPCPA